MSPADRALLLQHLDDQARTLAEMTASARDRADSSESLAQIRDQLFVMQETLDTLGVCHALKSHADWRRARGIASS
jgi:hypothetical protein